MGFLNLFVVALKPVLETLLITAVGLLLALDRVNLLGAVTRQHLNDLVFFVFTPALVASNLADTITASSIVSLWFMPVNILLTFIIGSALGWILVKITRTPQHLRGVVIGCCAAGNLGNLLLIIIPAVCEESNSPFGDSSTCSTNGLSYASLSMAVGAVYIWSYAYNIIRVYGSKSNGDININDSKISIESTGETSEIVSESCTEALLSKDCPSSEDIEAQAELPYTGSENEVKVQIFKKIKHHMKNFAEKINLKMLFAPSTIATIVGLFIGIVSPIRKIMIGDSAPLLVIYSSASLLGEAAIPSMTLIVGANLNKGLKRSGVSLWVIVGVQVVRYIALPLLGIVVVKAAHHFGMVGSDSLYQFVLLLQYALPSAMSIGTIAQLFEVGESECSVIMLWNYALASVSVTLWLTYYMWLVS
uniref:Auxin efflux carrier family protein n=1 Tax=Davidia involucrata TaxID=16924 RepID=A0A5B6ZI90_DAVIN